MSASPLLHLKVAGMVLRARMQGIGKGAALAPGGLSADEAPFSQDQFHVLKLHKKYGDVFKMWWGGKLTTCIVGHEKGMRFLTDNKDKMRVATIDMTPIFPLGFLRAMEGPDHAEYRKKVFAAFRSVDMKGQEDYLKGIIAEYLERLAEGSGKRTGAELARVAKSATTAIMLSLILGVEYGSDLAAKLTQAYYTYTPNGMHLVIGEKERADFEVIREMVAAHARELENSTGKPKSLLEHLAKEGQVDDTVIGNLIHMTEFARFDVHGLWRWILFEVSEHPDYLDRISAETDLEAKHKLAQSAASEALRMQQSEYIYRTAVETFVYDGYLIPKRSRVRVCIWEGHRDPEKFPDPDQYIPDRFAKKTYTNDSYAPLGLDHHACLGGNWTLTLGRMLVEVLADNYRLTKISDGTPIKGHFHFEPGPDSELSFKARQVSPVG